MMKKYKKLRSLYPSQLAKNYEGMPSWQALTYLHSQYMFLPNQNILLLQLDVSSCMKRWQIVGSEMNFKVFICFLLIQTSAANPLIATNKLSLATWGSYYQQDHMGPGTYAFGYDIEDPVTGNIQFKQEERHSNGTITGNYGYVDAEGRAHVVTYVADENGYRAKLEIEGEPTKFFPDKSSISQDVKPGIQETENNAFGKEKQNLLTVPLQGEVINPETPIYRLDYPSYYKYVGVNAVSK